MKPALIAESRSAKILAAWRHRRERPTMAQKIACVASIEELDAFRLEYLARNGALPTDVFRALVERRREIEGGRA